MPNNKLLVTAIIAALVLAGGFVVFKDNSNSGLPDETKINSPQTSNPVGSDNQAGENQSNGRYIEYTKTAFDSAANRKRVLFFYANWCPTCRPVDVELQKRMSELPPDVVVFRVNYNDSDTSDEEKGLANNYGVTYQHTFVVLDDAGNEVDKWNGGSVDTLISRV